MAIKIDLAKAYDQVESGVLLNLLDRLEFGDHLCYLVHVCISSARFSILINGFPFGFFPTERGFHQGDPMSPALFTIILDVLSRLLARVEEEGRLNGVKVSRTRSLVLCMHMILLFIVKLRWRKLRLLRIVLEPTVNGQDRL